MNHSEIDQEEANIVVRNLKTACDKKGKESDHKKSAQFLFQLGKLYRKQTPNKISLIKSVGLLNAAILRNPSNVAEVTQELNNLCRHILELANAERLDANLIEEADKVKQSIQNLRNDTLQMLNQVQTLQQNDDIDIARKHEIKTIEQIKKLQQKLYDEYSKIMAGIGEYCIEVLGKPPCKFSIAGMGSLARAEITPYSDFEHVIILEELDDYEEHTEYFRWFSVVFHVIILNLKETLVPYLDVSCLDGWFYDTRTPCGVSFDGMVPHACKFPLGRQQHTKKKPFSTELIQPISKMLEYLTTEVDLKNGYYLKDILTKTCFVFGNRNVYEKFETGVRTYYNKQSDNEISNDVKQQVKDDLNKFATRLKLKNLKAKDNFNVKEIIYRSSTLFVSALGRMHKIHASSCFEIIKCLAEKRVITQNTRHKLMFAVAVACQIRLKLYFENDSQFDFITVPRDIEKLKGFAGESNTRNYFQIAYCVQAEICKQLDFMPGYFYSHPELLNITICHALKMEVVLGRLLSDYDTLGKLDANDEQFNFDIYLDRLEQHASNLEIEKLVDYDLKNNFYKPFNFFVIGFFLFDLQRHEEAGEFFRRLYETHDMKIFKTNNDSTVVTTQVLKQIEKKLHQFQQENKTKRHYKRFLQFYKKRLSELTTNELQGAMFEISAFCFSQLNQLQTSLTHDNKALEIYQNMPNPNDHQNIATVFDNIGVTYGGLNKHQDSLNFHKKALEIYQKISSDKNNDHNIARVLDHIALSQRESIQYKKSLHNHQAALQIYQNISIDTDFDQNVARVYDNMGLILKDLNQHEKSLNCHTAALQIYKNITSDIESDQNVARVLDNIGVCKKNLKQFEESLVYYFKALLIYQNASSDVDNDQFIAELLDNIGLSQGNLKQYEESLEYHQEALQIFESISLDVDKDENIARVYDNIGLSYSDLQQYEESLQHHEKALKIYQNVSTRVANGKDLARVFDNIGLCHRNLEQLKESLHYHFEALHVYQSISSNLETDQDVARVLDNIGVNQRDLQKFEEALHHHQKALCIYHNVSSDPDRNENIARVLNNIGLCQRDLDQFEEALIHHKKALEIYENVSSDMNNDEIVAEVCDNIGLCLGDVGLFEESMDYHKKVLKIYENISFDVDSDKNVAQVLQSIGSCQLSLNKFIESVQNYKTSLQIYQNISTDPDNDENIAESCEKIGDCYRSLKQYDESLHYCKMGLQIYQNTSSDQNIDGNIANIFVNIAIDQAYLKQYEESLRSNQKALQICQNIVPDENANEDVAKLLENIAECHKHLHQYENALRFNKEALRVYQNISSDVNTDQNVTRVFDNIKLCEANLKQTEKAMSSCNQTVRVLFVCGSYNRILYVP